MEQRQPETLRANNKKIGNYIEKCPAENSPRSSNPPRILTAWPATCPKSRSCPQPLFPSAIHSVLLRTCSGSASIRPEFSPCSDGTLSSQLHNVIAAFIGRLHRLHSIPLPFMPFRQTDSAFPASIFRNSSLSLCLPCYCPCRFD